MQQIKKEEQDSKALVKRSENEARILIEELSFPLKKKLPEMVDLKEKIELD